MKKLLIILLALSMLLCCGCAGETPDVDFEEQETETTTVPQADLAPEITVYDRAGNSVSLSDMRGKPVVINFWATWCGPCKSELPAFQQAYEAYGEDICFMMVDMVSGRTETKAGAIEYVDGEGYTFPLYFDEDETAVYAYAISAVPATFVIDAQGVLVDSHVGAMSYDALEALLQSVL